MVKPASRSKSKWVDAQLLMFFLMMVFSCSKKYHMIENETVTADCASWNAFETHFVSNVSKWIDENWAVERVWFVDCPFQFSCVWYGEDHAYMTTSVFKLSFLIRFAGLNFLVMSPLIRLWSDQFFVPIQFTNTSNSKYKAVDYYKQ